MVGKKRRRTPSSIIPKFSVEVLKRSVVDSEWKTVFDKVDTTTINANRVKELLENDLFSLHSVRALYIKQ